MTIPNMSMLAQSQRMREHLNGLLSQVLDASVAADRATTERFISFIGATVALLDQHAVDARGRCRCCRSARPWSRIRTRQPCTVHDEFARYLARADLPDTPGWPRPLAYGYVHRALATDRLMITPIEQRLKSYAERQELDLATIFYEQTTGHSAALEELIRELQRADAHTVIVPSLDHLSRYSSQQLLLVERLADEATATVVDLADRPRLDARAIAADRRLGSPLRKEVSK